MGLSKEYQINSKAINITQQNKGDKPCDRPQHWKGRSKQLQFINDMIIYVEILKESFFFLNLKKKKSNRNNKM